MEVKMIEKSDEIIKDSEKMTVLQVGERVAKTDLTDCILYAFGHEYIKDEGLAKLWLEAKVAINKVDDYLKARIGDDYAWGEFEVK
jgi:hypothetical protein